MSSSDHRRGTPSRFLPVSWSDVWVVDFIWSVVGVTFGPSFGSRTVLEGCRVPTSAEGRGSKGPMSRIVSCAREVPTLKKENKISFTQRKWDQDLNSRPSLTPSILGPLGTWYHPFPVPYPKSNDQRVKLTSRPVTFSKVFTRSKVRSGCLSLRDPCPGPLAINLYKRSTQRRPSPNTWWKGLYGEVPIEVNDHQVV